jgi:hypothetical protein
MSLKSILAAKGEEVVSIDFTDDLAAAAKLLTKRHIGALASTGALPAFCPSATSYAR